MKHTTTIPVCVVAAMLLAGASHAQDAAAGSNAPRDGRVLIGGAEYKKLDTREATELRMLNELFPDRGRWGEWYLLTPFPFEYGSMGKALPPEAELARMAHGGPGPDLNAVYRGKGGVEAAWRPVGDIGDRMVELRLFDRNELNEDFAAYLYGTVEVDRPVTVDVTMGSDDGLRFWVNGRLVVDSDVLRGLNPEDERVRLDLKPGVNHLFAKVTQVKGAAAFQINTRAPLDPLIDAQIQYQLDQDFPRAPEEKYYRALTVVTPDDVVLEVGGLDVLPDGRPIACTRRGDVYIVEGAYDEPPFNARFKKFAEGLHEPLGLAVRVENGGPAVYCVQRGELTRLVDTDGDDVADLYETVNDGWGVSGNYHEFAFGPKFDREGNAWVTLNVGFCAALGKSVVPYRGWALKITPEGELVPVCDGMRSPNGIGMYADGSMFYLDNQGDYVGTNKLAWLRPGSWHGHPSTLRWRQDWSPGQEPPPRQHAAVWFPYKKMGQSTADFLLVPEEGPAAGMWPEFKGQIFVGDQTLASVMRVDLEKIDGVYQGACFPFRQNLDCGVNRLAWGKDGSMLVGQTDRGWGSVGRRRYGLQRIVPSGRTPFEVRTMHVTPNGFELTFTKDLDPAAARDPASYSMSSYTYEYHETYGSDEMDTQKRTITGVELVSPRTVRLTLDALRTGDMGYVHELHLPGVRDAEGNPLLHTEAYYTLHKIPGAEGGGGGGAASAGSGQAAAGR